MSTDTIRNFATIFTIFLVLVSEAESILCTTNNATEKDGCETQCCKYDCCSGSCCRSGCCSIQETLFYVLSAVLVVGFLAFSVWKNRDQPFVARLLGRPVPNNTITQQPHNGGSLNTTSTSPFGNSQPVEQASYGNTQPSSMGNYGNILSSQNAANPPGTWASNYASTNTSSMAAPPSYSDATK